MTLNILSLNKDPLHHSGILPRCISLVKTIHFFVHQIPFVLLVLIVPLVMIKLVVFNSPVLIPLVMVVRTLL